VSTEWFRDVVSELVERRRFAFPLYIVTVSRNGAAVIVELPAEGEDGKTIYRDDQPHALPINIMVTDAMGRDAHVRIDVKGALSALAVGSAPTTTGHAS